MVLDGRPLHDHTSLKANSRTDLDARANHDIGPNHGGRVNLGGWVDENVAGEEPWLGSGGEERRLLLGEVGEVEAGSGDVIYKRRVG